MTAVPPPLLSYLNWGILLFFLALVQYRIFDIRGYLLQQHRKLYAYASYIGLVIISIGVFGALNYSGNILMIRATENGNSGHLLSWLSVMIIAYVFGYDDIIRGAMTAGAYAAMHELISVGITLASGAYGADLGITLNQAVWNYSTFFVLLAAIIANYFVFLGCSSWPAMKRASFLLLIYSLVIGSIGGIGTLNLLGPTQYFNNLDVSLVEQLSWVVPSITFLGLSIERHTHNPTAQELAVGVFDN